MESGRGAYVAAAFFAFGGVLHFALTLFAGEHPAGFWELWDAAGRGLLGWFVAWGLLRRLSVFRAVASVYCVVMLLTYLCALLLAYTRTPAAFPRSLIGESLYEIPSCALLAPYLLSSEAAQVFSRSLFR